MFTRSSAQVLFCLRQHGTSHFVCISFCALRAQNEIKKKGKYRFSSTTVCNKTTCESILQSDISFPSLSRTIYGKMISRTRHSKGDRCASKSSSHSWSSHWF